MYQLPKEIVHFHLLKFMILSRINSENCRGGSEGLLSVAKAIWSARAHATRQSCFLTINWIIASKRGFHFQAVAPERDDGSFEWNPENPVPFFHSRTHHAGGNRNRPNNAERTSFRRQRLFKCRTPFLTRRCAVNFVRQRGSVSTPRLPT